MTVPVGVTSPTLPGRDRSDTAAHHAFGPCWEDVAENEPAPLLAQVAFALNPTPGITDDNPFLRPDEICSQTLDNTSARRPT